MMNKFRDFIEDLLAKWVIFITDIFESIESLFIE